jgi:hypothetical protein
MALAPVVACSSLLLSAAHAGTALPKTFTGSLSGSEKQAPWSFGTGHFTGYSAKFTITKLVFGSGAQGPYTLLSGTLKFNDFVESLKAPTGGGPAATIGTCRARYTFRRIGAVSGDLGSFSQTRGVWHAIVDLGIQTQANKITATGCGPNLENTENEFGNPPRIALSISATGTFNPATGVLTFAPPKRTPKSSTPKSSTGGVRTDVVKGTLRGSG